LFELALCCFVVSSGFPLLPRYHGEDDDLVTEEEAEVRSSHSLSSVTNDPDAEEVDPPPLYIPPHPLLNEKELSSESIQRLFKVRSPQEISSFTSCSFCFLFLFLFIFSLSKALSCHVARVHHSTFLLFFFLLFCNIFLISFFLFFFLFLLFLFVPSSSDLSIFLGHSSHFELAELVSQPSSTQP
jgi:hypothetical protein